MDLLVVVLRLVHVVLGALWVGMMVFATFFLMPALRDVGPEGGRVMLALQRRGVMLVMPIIGLAAIVSGIWLVERIYGGMTSLMASRAGLAFALGGAVSLIALILGITVMRPAMLRATALAQVLQSAQSDQEREERTAEIHRMRARGAAAGRVATLLLILAVAAMAVARYL